MWFCSEFKVFYIIFIVIATVKNVKAINSNISVIQNSTQQQQQQQLNIFDVSGEGQAIYDNDENIGELLLKGEKNLSGYCNIYRCEENHIACNNSGKLGPQCPPTITIIDMKNYKFMIVKMHNKFRNIVAGGFKQLRPSVRMAEMDWDDELALLAHLFVKTCDRRTSKCHHTKRFRQSGHNSGSYTYSGLVDEMTFTELIQGRIKAWFSGWKNLTNVSLRKYERGHSYPTATVMLAERNTNIGCAAAFFEKNAMHKFVIYCLYATTNIIGRPTYIAGKVPGSNCKVGKSKVYQNLCAVGELYTDADYKQFKGRRNNDDFYDDQGDESVSQDETKEAVQLQVEVVEIETHNANDNNNKDSNINNNKNDNVNDDDDDDDDENEDVDDGKHIIAKQEITEIHVQQLPELRSISAVQKVEETKFKL